MPLRAVLIIATSANATALLAQQNNKILRENVCRNIKKTQFFFVVISRSESLLDENNDKTFMTQQDFLIHVQIDIN